MMMKHQTITQKPMVTLLRILGPWGQTRVYAPFMALIALNLLTARNCKYI